MQARLGLHAYLKSPTEPVAFGIVWKLELSDQDLSQSSPAWLFSAATSARLYKQHFLCTVTAPRRPEHALLFRSGCLPTSNRRVSVWPGCAQLRGAGWCSLSITATWHPPRQLGSGVTGPLRPQTVNDGHTHMDLFRSLSSGTCRISLCNSELNGARVHQIPRWQDSRVANVTEWAVLGARCWGWGLISPFLGWEKCFKIWKRSNIGPFSIGASHHVLRREIQL